MLTFSLAPFDTVVSHLVILLYLSCWTIVRDHSHRSCHVTPRRFVMSSLNHMNLSSYILPFPPLISLPLSSLLCKCPPPHPHPMLLPFHRQSLLKKRRNHHRYLHINQIPFYHHNLITTYPSFAGLGTFFEGRLANTDGVGHRWISLCRR